MTHVASDAIASVLRLMSDTSVPEAKVMTAINSLDADDMPAFQDAVDAESHKCGSLARIHLQLNYFTWISGNDRTTNKAVATAGAAAGAAAGARGKKKTSKTQRLVSKTTIAATPPNDSAAGASLRSDICPWSMGSSTLHMVQLDDDADSGGVLMPCRSASPFDFVDDDDDDDDDYHDDDGDACSACALLRMSSPSPSSSTSSSASSFSYHRDPPVEKEVLYFLNDGY